MLNSIFRLGATGLPRTGLQRRVFLGLVGLSMFASLSGCGGTMTDNGSFSSMPLTKTSLPGNSVADGGSSAKAVAEKTVGGKSGALATPTLASPALASPPSGPLAASAERPTPNSASKGSSASKVAETMTASATPGNSAYRVGALDVLDISVYKAPDLSKSVQVADSGTVNLPLIDDIQAVGKTAQEIERDIAAKLGSKYLQKPQVTVFVKEYNSQRVTIEGAVKKPGVYPIRGTNSLLQFIAMAEGLDQISDSTVLVFRTTDGKRSAAKFDINEIRAGTAPDPSLKSGDVVVAPTSTMKEVFNNLMKVVPLANVFAIL